MHRLASPSCLRYAALACALVLADAGTARAHAKTESLHPECGSTVTAPQAVRITFNVAIEPAFSTLWVSDALGRQVSTARSTVDSATRRTVRVPLPPLPAGQYRVYWIAVAQDGHRVQGNYVFDVR